MDGNQKVFGTLQAVFGNRSLPLLSSVSSVSSVVGLNAILSGNFAGFLQRAHS
jgi:hypothetical protein